MSLYLDDGDVRVLHGDCIHVMRELAAESIDAVCTDPPYALSFMGREWDTHANPLAFQHWCQAWASECLRVLKPGGHLVSFSGTRTAHRMVCGIEDAGFEIRDTLAWLYGSGFPKSLDVSKAIDKAAGAAWQGWGTALKPAHEPITLARKPLRGTVAANVLAFGTGALNIDATRIGTTKDIPASASGVGSYGGNPNGQPSDASGLDPNVGRWPANVILDTEAAALLDQQTGELAPGGGDRRSPGAGRVAFGEFAGDEAPRDFAANRGGASRFFYTSKASSSERSEGLDDERNGHPTVKPVDLMRWLIRLLAPPGALILDPFAGSGTTGVAARLESVRCILIEREAEYLPIIAGRLSQQSLLS